MATGFGIVGCGMIAHFHARAIADVRGAKLVAGFDTVPAAADRLAEATGCKPYYDLKKMLADPDVDVVTIGTPSGAHLEPAVAAARAGKHVIVEKPLEITLRRCDRIIRECEKAGVVLSSIFPSRFHAPSLEIKRAIDAGRFGRLTVGDAIVKWYRTQEYYDSGAWRGTWELDGGGALMNQAIHTVDLLTWLMGPVVEIRAQTALLAHKRIAVEDVAMATVRFANGAMGIIEASTAVYPGYLKRIEIHGTEGSAIMEEEDIVKWDFARKNRRDAAIHEAMAQQQSGGGGAADPSAIGHHGHTRQFQDVLKAIKKGTSASVDGTEGRRSVEIILALYKAAETGRAVALPLKSDPVLKARKTGVGG
ncbi:MAG: Gfo/Idh/MocA family oxidoreductase [Candidatus Nealsonbacteria bacterium]|nr:Gfo/Idh/MocA family oxidoreductase [Candidatus Nealsonbacteria bacterium]